MKRFEAEKDIILSTRFRLARNIKGLNFISKMNAEEKQLLNSGLSEEISSNPLFRDFQIYNIDELDELDRILFKERKFISERFYRGGSGLVVLDEPRQTSIVTGDLDHIRISSISEGLDIDSVLDRTLQIEEALSSRYDFISTEEDGFLTACVKQSGLAAKGSIFLHLPVLNASDLMDHLIIDTIETRLEVTGFSGGGEKSLGGLYIISTRNGSSSDLSQSVNHLQRAAALFMENEIDARKDLRNGKYPILEDRIFRSYGLLKYCRQISEQEALSALSLVRLGVSVGWLNNISGEDFSEVFRSIGNGYLRSFAYESNPDENDIMRLRADTIRRGLNLNL